MPETTRFLSAERMLASEENAIVSGEVDANGDLILVKKSGAEVNAGSVIGPVAGEEAIAEAYGYALVVSDTPPASTTLYGQPVVWVKGQSLLQNVPTAPTAPSFNVSTFAVTVPSVVGVKYEFRDPAGTWHPLAAGETSLSGYARPYTVKVRAIALPGYVLPSTYLWEQLFYNEAALTLFGSDDGTGTAGAVVAQANSSTTGQRIFNNALGGSSTGGAIPRWWSQSSVPAGIVIDPTGTKFTKNPDAASMNATSGWAWFNVDADNCRVEFEITNLAIVHARGVQIYLGSNTTGGLTGAPVDLSVNASAFRIRFLPTAGLTGDVEYTYKSGVTEADVRGVWKVAWINKTLRVDAPNGTSYSRDYSGSTFAFGQRAIFRISGTSDVFPTADNIKVYR